jgi:hypothetical protein
MVMMPVPPESSVQGPLKPPPSTGLRIQSMSIPGDQRKNSFPSSNLIAVNPIRSPSGPIIVMLMLSAAVCTGAGKLFPARIHAFTGPGAGGQLLGLKAAGGSGKNREQEPEKANGGLHHTNPEKGRVQATLPRLMCAS